MSLACRGSSGLEARPWERRKHRTSQRGFKFQLRSVNPDKVPFTLASTSSSVRGRGGTVNVTGPLGRLKKTTHVERNSM